MKSHFTFPPNPAVNRVPSFNPGCGTCGPSALYLLNQVHDEDHPIESAPGVEPGLGSKLTNHCYWFFHVLASCHCMARAWPSSIFDATLGFPGEGPIEACYAGCGCSLTPHFHRSELHGALRRKVESAAAGASGKKKERGKGGAAEFKKCCHALPSRRSCEDHSHDLKDCNVLHPPITLPSRSRSGTSDGDYTAFLTSGEEEEDHDPICAGPPPIRRATKGSLPGKKRALKRPLKTKAPARQTPLSAPKGRSTSRKAEKGGQSKRGTRKFRALTDLEVEIEMKENNFYSLLSIEQEEPPEEKKVTQPVEEVTAPREQKHTQRKAGAPSPKRPVPKKKKGKPLQDRSRQNSVAVRPVMGPMLRGDVVAKDFMAVRASEDADKLDPGDDSQIEAEVKIHLPPAGVPAAPPYEAAEPETPATVDPDPPPTPSREEGSGDDSKELYEQNLWNTTILYRTGTQRRGLFNRVMSMLFTRDRARVDGQDTLDFTPIHASEYRLRLESFRIDWKVARAAEWEKTVNLLESVYDSSREAQVYRDVYESLITDHSLAATNVFDREGLFSNYLFLRIARIAGGLPQYKMYAKLEGHETILFDTITRAANYFVVRSLYFKAAAPGHERVDFLVRRRALVPQSTGRSRGNTRRNALLRRHS